MFLLSVSIYLPVSNWLYGQSSDNSSRLFHLWLVVWTPLKNISQLGWLFPTWENKKCSKPPTRPHLLPYFHLHLLLHPRRPNVRTTTTNGTCFLTPWVPQSLHQALVADLATPLKNMSSSIGMMTFPIFGKIKLMFQTTNQKISVFLSPSSTIGFYCSWNQVEHVEQSSASSSSVSSSSSTNLCQESSLQKPSSSKSPISHDAPIC